MLTNGNAPCSALLGSCRLGLVLSVRRVIMFHASCSTDLSKLPETLPLLRPGGSREKSAAGMEC